MIAFAQVGKKKARIPRRRASQRRVRGKGEIVLPAPGDWRTSDQDERNRRKQRAKDERFSITNLGPGKKAHSNFRLGSSSGLIYSVEIRDLKSEQFACECVDFRINGLGTCKHVEAVLLHLEA